MLAQPPRPALPPLSRALISTIATSIRLSAASCFFEHCLGTRPLLRGDCGFALRLHALGGFLGATGFSGDALDRGRFGALLGREPRFGKTPSFRFGFDAAVRPRFRLQLGCLSRLRLLERARIGFGACSSHGFHCAIRFAAGGRLLVQSVLGAGSRPRGFERLLLGRFASLCRRYGLALT